MPSGNTAPAILQRCRARRAGLRAGGRERAQRRRRRDHERTQEALERRADRRDAGRGVPLWLSESLERFHGDRYREGAARTRRTPSCPRRLDRGPSWWTRLNLPPYQGRSKVTKLAGLRCSRSLLDLRLIGRRLNAASKEKPDWTRSSARFR